MMILIKTTLRTIGTKMRKQTCSMVNRSIIWKDQFVLYFRIILKGLATADAWENVQLHGNLKIGSARL